jgi:hypothetical protein
VTNSCPQSGTPVEHSDRIEADETWGAGLHDVTFGIVVENNATLTISPCATVRVETGAGFQVRQGKLVAKGQADQPIVFEGKDGVTWGNIEVDSLGFTDLEYVTIQNAGDLNSTRGGAGAALHLYQTTDYPLQPLAKVDHVTIDGAVRFGVELETHGTFSSDSQNLRIKNSGEMAMWAGSETLGTIPPGDYTGNHTDAIRIITDYVNANETIHDPGVPYVVGGDGSESRLIIEGDTTTPVPVLTIEPGVTMKFPKTERDSGIFVDEFQSTNPAAGALVAVGTQDKPIIFTSAEATPMAGDWIGVWFDSVPDPQDRLDWVFIQYAGGETGAGSASCGTPQAIPTDHIGNDQAAIAIFGPPTSQFVTNTTITDSAFDAIDRAWTNDPIIDFRPTNTFTNITYCSQTYPRQEGPNAQCPSSCDP